MQVCSCAVRELTSVLVCVCIYMCMHARIIMYVCTRIYVCACVCVHVCMRAYVRVCVRACVHACMCVRICVCMYNYVPCKLGS